MAPKPSEQDITKLIDRELREAVKAGQHVRHIAGWRRECRERILANESSLPGFVWNSARAIDAQAKGRRVTYCRETRGSHGVSHVYDPAGTDPPPSGWSLDLARSIDRQRAG